MRLLLLRLLPLAVTVLLCPPTAVRATGVYLVTWGDTVKNLGNVTNRQNLKRDAPQDLKVSFKYSYVGLFWIDFWTWGGEYWLYHEETKSREPISKEQAAALMGVSEDSIGKPFLYR